MTGALKIGWFLPLICGVAAGVFSDNAGADEPEPTDATAEEFFENSVRPLFVERCHKCHNADKHKGGLVLDSRASLLTGGDTGAAITPGKPDESLLIEAVRYGADSYQMPPNAKLADEQIAILERWVKIGAPWPTSPDAPSKTANGNEFDFKTRAEHWSFQPIRSVEPPVVRDKDWPRSPIDDFILAKLEAADLRPAPPADRRTLLRRVTFDLIGLPPTPQQIDAFGADDSDDAFATVVDRLLNSPHYGERWGRHWLDLVRFAETAGHEFDFDMPSAYRYRDYVIRSFSADVPFDQFVVEHIAGDLVEQPRRHPIEHFNESIIGTGFFYLGESKHSPVDILGDEAARFDNQIDVLSKTFLGLTVGCARCHDHKFDPISTRDYYALKGYLQSSRYQDADIDDPAQIESCVAELNSLNQRVRESYLSATAPLRDDFLDRLDVYLLSAREVLFSGSETAKSDDGKDSSDASVGADEATDEATRILIAEVAEKRSISELLLARLVEHLKSTALAQEQDPLHLWAALSRAAPGQTAGEFVAAKEVVLDRWRRANNEYDRSTADAQLFDDFGRPDFGDWTVTGQAFSAGPSRDFEPTFSAESPGNLSGAIYPATAHSGRTSPVLRGVLRSRTFEIPHDKIWYRVAGKGAKINLIIDSFQQIRAPIYGGLTFAIDHGDRFVWHVQDVSMWRGHRAYIEVIDPGPGYVAVEEIWLADGAPPRGNPPNPILLAGFDNRGDKTPDALAHRYADVIRECWNQWHSGAASPLPKEGIAGVIDWLLKQTALQSDVSADDATVDEKAADELAQLLAEREEVAQSVPVSRRVMAMLDGTGENERVHIRGNHKQLGEEVPRRLLTVLGGESPAAMQSGSGRLLLAQKMVAAENPLLPRVMVNRIWQHHFGRGIVASPNNFGILGQPPSHPDLLDFLAKRFVESGWSIKKMHRLMVLSSTYQMSSRSHSPSDEEADPANVLWHRMPIRRLEGEAIRDAVLAVSGELDTTSFGPGVAPHLTPFMSGRGRPKTSGPLDGAGRRSVYINVRRNFLTPLFLAFDYPLPFTSIGRRGVSNTPSQALVMMNNPFVAEQAQRWASRLLAEPDRTPHERIVDMYVHAYGRPPDEGELSLALEFLGSDVQNLRPEDALAAWANLCHVLYNVKEFIFIK